MLVCLAESQQKSTTLKVNVQSSKAMKNVYFLSDAHLGSLAIPHQRMQ